MSERRTASALAYLHPDFCFTVEGDRMAGAGIRPGDVVYFAACDQAEPGEIVAVATPTSVLLLRTVCGGQLLTDCPFQGKSTCFSVAEHPEFKILGRAVMQSRLLSVNTAQNDPQGVQE